MRKRRLKKLILEEKTLKHEDKKRLIKRFNKSCFQCGRKTRSLFLKNIAEFLLRIFRGILNIFGVKVRYQIIDNETLNVDHHNPSSFFNAINSSNAVALCYQCNQKKGNLLPEEFYSTEKLVELDQMGISSRHNILREDLDVCTKTINDLFMAHEREIRSNQKIRSSKIKKVLRNYRDKSIRDYKDKKDEISGWPSPIKRGLDLLTEEHFTFLKWAKRRGIVRYNGDEKKVFRAIKKDFKVRYPEIYKKILKRRIKRRKS